MLFADVRGFTSFSESRTPEEVVATLNEYFGEVVEVIAVQEGVLDKFIGDGLMAVFDAPIDQPDHAERAVRTGLGMQAAVAAMNARRAARGQPPVEIGSGQGPRSPGPGVPQAHSTRHRRLGEPGLAPRHHAKKARS